MADLAAWWTTTLVGVDMTLFMTRRVAIGPMSMAMFVAKGATSTIRRGLVGSECCNSGCQSLLRFLKNFKTLYFRDEVREVGEKGLCHMAS